MSSVQVPFRLRLTAAQDGLDPFTHYWYKVGHRSYHRVCDHAPWVGGAQYESPPHVDCSHCSSMHHDDRRYGRRMFKLTRVPKGYLAPRPCDVLYTPNDRFSIGDNGAMQPVRMEQFIEFVFATTDKRGTAIVCDYIDDKSGGGRNPYGRLLKAMRCSGQRAANLKRARPQPSKGWRAYVDDYTVILDRVIAFCERENAEIYDLPCTQVTVGGLPVYVEPEVRMAGDFGQWAVKLCLARSPLPPEHADVTYILLQDAQLIDPCWPYFPRFWDVRSQPIPLELNPSQELRQRVAAAGADFMERYDRLNRQLPLHDDGDDEG